MPASRIFEFTDPHPYQETIRAAQIELFPTTKGDFRAALLQIDLNRLWMQGGCESLPSVSHGLTSPERASIKFLVGLDQPAFQHNGIDVLLGDIVFNDRRPMHRRYFPPHYWGAMSLTPADLAAAGRVLVGRELSVPPVTRIVRPAPDLMAHLVMLYTSTVQLARTSPEKLAHPEVVRSLEQALIRAMIRCLTEGTTAEEGVTVRYHTAVMARLEDFLAANHDRPVYLADLCAATRVSERTLRVCCQEQLGVGPVRYLWLRRMHLARRALMYTDPAATTESLC
jgi:AraC-like DNA-binding protein